MCTINIYNPIDVHLQYSEALEMKRIVEALNKLGVDIHLRDFSKDQSSYTNGPAERVLLTDGPDAFPVTVVDGEIFQKKSYPDYYELLKWSGLDQEQ